MRDLSQTIATTSYKKTEGITALQINFALCLLLVAVGLVYLFSVNTMATEGYRIKQLSAQISKLEEEHKGLELQSSTLQSVSTIQSESTLSNFVPATNVTYIKDDSFALK
jgi:hypothetical protein